MYYWKVVARVYTHSSGNTMTSVTFLHKGRTIYNTDYYDLAPMFDWDENYSALPTGLMDAQFRVRNKQYEIILVKRVWAEKDISLLFV